ncbi:Uncharacterised protein [Mycobacteroides abscessus subsp. massiliense]|nr:Uncharacterised protein [Mycobacteroides abscessus subsp. massiliense]
MQVQNAAQRLSAALEAMGCPRELQEQFSFQEAWPTPESLPRVGGTDPDPHCEGSVRAWVRFDLLAAATIAPNVFGTLSTVHATELDAVARALSRSGQVLWALDVREPNSWRRWSIPLKYRALHVAELLYCGRQLSMRQLHDAQVALHAVCSAVWGPAPPNAAAFHVGTGGYIINNWTLGPLRAGPRTSLAECHES